jgi:hypothetical protein
MLNRYRKQFVDEPAKYPKYLDIEEVVDYSKFGV